METAKRLVVLERRVKRQQALLICVAVLTSAAMMFGSGQGGDVVNALQCRRLAIVDADGVERIVFDGNEQPEVASMRMFNGEGKLRLRLFTTKAIEPILDMVSLALFEADETRAMDVTAGLTGGASLTLGKLTLSSDSEAASIRLETRKSGPYISIDCNGSEEVSSVRLMASDGKRPRIGIGVDATSLGEEAKIEVVGSDSRRRARIAVSDDEAPLVSLIDAASRTRISASVEEDGSAVRFYDENQNPRMSVIVGTAGPHIGFIDGDKRVRLAVGLDSRGPALRVLDDAAVTRLYFGMGAEGPELFANDVAGAIRMHAGVFGETPIIRMYDSAKNSRLLAGVFESGPKWSVADEKGIVRSSLGAEAVQSPEGVRITYPESSLLLFGPDRRVLWKAP